MGMSIVSHQKVTIFTNSKVYQSFALTLDEVVYLESGSSFIFRSPALISLLSYSVTVRHGFDFM